MEACPGKPEKSDFEKIIDDIIQWSGDLEAAFFRICAILSHCNQNGIMFSPEKFEFAKESSLLQPTSVKFVAGLV